MSALHSLLTLEVCSLLALTSVSAVTDARSGRIPNGLTLSALALAPLVHLLLGGPGGLARSLVGAAACGLVPLALFWRGGMGGGDVKLLTAMGAVAGAPLGLTLQIGGYVAGAAFALAVLVLRRERVREVRLGPPIFVATATLLLLPLLPNLGGGP